VHEFEYLGSYFSDRTGKAHLEGELMRQRPGNDISQAFQRAPIVHRLRKANKRFSCMHQFFNLRAPVKLKVRAFMAYVYPVATWGCESWTYTGTVDNELNYWFRKKMRILLRVTKEDHIPTEVILNATQTRDLTETLTERRLRYFGHIVRYPDDRWVRTCMNADLEQKGHANRKNTTWQKQIAADFKQLKADFDDCYDRDRWRLIITGKLEIVLLDGSIRSDAAAAGRRRTGRRDYDGSINRAPANYMADRGAMAQAISGKCWNFINRNRFLVEGGEHQVEREEHIDHLGVVAKIVYGQQFYLRQGVYVTVPPRPNFQDRQRELAQSLSQKRWQFKTHNTFVVEGGDGTIHTVELRDFDENLGEETYTVYGKPFFKYNGLFKIL
jgi:hypothetical protein